MNRILVILSIVLPLTVACQKSDDTTLQGTTTTTGTVQRPKLVRNARGIYLSHACMQANGDALQKIVDSKGIEAASAQLETWCDVKSMKGTAEGAKACAPNCYVGQVPWSSYYYPPSYYGGYNQQQGGQYNSNNTNVNLTFNNYFYGGGYNYNGYQMLGYNQNQAYNPYPQGYQQYPQYNGSQYNYSNYNYGNTQSYQPSQPFYYNTNYYNQAPSNQFCNTSCMNGTGVGCANTCWYGTQSTQLGYTGTGYSSGATVIQ